MTAPAKPAEPWWFCWRHRGDRYSEPGICPFCKDVALHEGYCGFVRCNCGAVPSIAPPAGPGEAVARRRVEQAKALLDGVGGQIPDVDAARIMLREALEAQPQGADDVARRWYHADGTYEVMPTVEAAIARRIEAAKRLEQGAVDVAGWLRAFAKQMEAIYRAMDAKQLMEVAGLPGETPRQKQRAAIAAVNGIGFAADAWTREHPAQPGACCAACRKPYRDEAGQRRRVACPDCRSLYADGGGA